MRPRPLLTALLMTAFASGAAAQQAEVQQITPQQAVPQPTQAPKPAPVKPKQKPAAAATPAKKPVPAGPEAKAHLLEKIKDWTVFIYEGAEGGRVCFAATAPTDTQPRTLKRTPVVFYVTTWQKDGVRNEVSLKQGYTMKANAVATVTVGSQNFMLAAGEDKAYAKDPADEQRLLTAMAGGGLMIVKAASAKGTQTTDQYSLDGASEAVQKMQEACP